MRRSVVAVCVVLAASIAAAEEPMSPAAYLAILTESKLHYTLLGEPSRTPAEIQKCPPRNESMRVVQNGAEKKLVPWPLNLDAAKLLGEGETFYEAGNFDEAAARYKAALEKDPELAAGYLFYGDALLIGKDDPENALKQYQKAIALDSTLPKAHFFASSAYLKLGRRADAREEIVRALAYYPSYESIWKIALKSPEVWDAKPVTRHEFQPPAGLVGVRGAKGIDIYGGPEGRWLGYAICKAVWANEPQFEKRRAKNGGWSIEEEHACVVNQLLGELNKAESKHSALPPLEAHLYEVANAGMLDAYILFEIIGRNCPIMLSIMNDAARQQVEAYVRKYVIVAR